jgi:hypothetical protein
VIGILILMVFGHDLSKAPAEVMPLGEWAAYARGLATTTFLLAATAIWFGCSNAAREIVAEWSVYQRERMVNLGIPSYVLSKLTVLGALSAMQCVVLLGLVYVGCSFKGSLLGMLMVLLLASFVGLGIGLVVSALARSSEVAIAVVPLILLPMVILAGSLQPVHKMSSGVRALSAAFASRWAFEGLLLREAQSRARSVPAPCASPAPCVGAVGASISEPGPIPSSVREPDFAEDVLPMGTASSRLAGPAAGGAHLDARRDADRPHVDLEESRRPLTASAWPRMAASAEASACVEGKRCSGRLASA